MSLPKFYTQLKEFSLLQTQWAAAIDPVLALPTNGAIILKSVVLAIGDNTISHKLGRALQGWSIVRVRAATTIYDKQDSNTMPDRTLVLNSSAGATVDILVF